MVKLGCEVKNCAHNKEDLCCKNAIMIGGSAANQKEDTTCDSFMQRREGASNSTVIASEMTTVNCAANNCTHNKDCNCKANHVTIDGHRATCKDETICNSFSEKSF